MPLGDFDYSLYVQQLRGEIEGLKDFLRTERGVNGELRAKLAGHWAEIEERRQVMADIVRLLGHGSHGLGNQEIVPHLKAKLAEAEAFRREHVSCISLKSRLLQTELENQELQRQNKVMREALETIARYDNKKHPGICEYGCDSPHIAQQALSTPTTPPAHDMPEELKKIEKEVKTPKQWHEEQGFQPDPFVSFPEGQKPHHMGSSTPPKDMTDNQIRIAIAEYCGYKDIVEEYMSVFTEKEAVSIPKYLDDLNAMHEAEGYLNLALVSKYNELLAKEVDVLNGIFNKTGPRGWVFHATARQRAIAYVKTIGKWQD